MQQPTAASAWSLLFAPAPLDRRSHSSLRSRPATIFTYRPAQVVHLLKRPVEVRFANILFFPVSITSRFVVLRLFAVDVTFAK